MAYFIFPEGVFEAEGQGKKYSCFMESRVPVAVKLAVFIVLIVSIWL